MGWYTKTVDNIDLLKCYAIIEFAEFTVAGTFWLLHGLYLQEDKVRDVLRCDLYMHSLLRERI